MNEEQDISPYWLDDQGEFKRHEFQIVIDALALAHNLPLRLLDCTELNKVSAARLWYLSEKHKGQALDFTDEKLNKDAEEKLIQFCAEVQQLFTNKDHNCSKWNDDSFPPALKHLAKDNKQCTSPRDGIFSIDQKLWLNLPSNPLPIHILFRHSEEWCWFILVWFFVEIRKKLTETNGDNKPFFMNAFYMKGLNFHFRWIDIGVNKQAYLLVIGPVYEHDSIRTAQDFDQNKVKNIIIAFQSFYIAYCEKSLTHLAEEETLRRLSHLRFYISQPEINSRLRRIVNVLQSMSATLGSVKIPKNEYQDYYALTLIYIIIHDSEKILWWIQDDSSAKKWSEKILRGIQDDYTMKKARRFPLTLTFHLPHQTSQNHITIDVDIKSEIELEIRKITFCEHNNCNCDLKIKHIFKHIRILKSFLTHISSNDPSIEKLLTKKGKTKKTVQRDKLLEINRKSERLDERINMRLRSSQVLRNNMINSWLQKHYAGLTPEYTKQPNNNKYNILNRRIYHYICHAILEEFRADSAILYKVSYSSGGKLEVLAGVYSTAKEQAKHNNYVKEIETITESDEKDHVVFNAIETGKIKKYPDDVYQCHQGESYIVVPIKFQGYVYGALKITGLKIYQFPWLHPFILHNISNILVEYFYNQQMIFALQHLTKNVLQYSSYYHAEFEETVIRGKEVYITMCRSLGDIFLANEVGLWLRDPCNAERYLLAGAIQYENPIINIKHENPNKHLTISHCLFKWHQINKNNFITFEITANDKSEFIELKSFYSIGNDYFTESSDSDDLKNSAKNYRSGIAFVITEDKSPSTNDKIVGYVCLYYRNNSADSNQNWRNIIELVNKQLMIAFEALETFGSFRDIESSLLYHEIKQDAWVLSEITKELEKTVKFFHLNFSKSVSNKEDLITLKKQRDNLIDVRKRLDWKISLREEFKKISLIQLFGADAMFMDFNEMNVTIDLRTVIQDVFQSKQDGFKKKGTYVDFSQISKNSLLCMNKNMLYTMIQNLLENAQKYSIEHSSVTMKLEKNTINNKCVLSISSIGQPLTEVDLRHHFDPFSFGSRSNFSQEHDNTGDGMGLYTVSRICDFHNIKYEFSHKPINTSEEFTFSFEIPNNLFRDR